MEAAPLFTSLAVNESLAAPTTDGVAVALTVVVPATPVTMTLLCVAPALALVWVMAIVVPPVTVMALALLAPVMALLMVTVPAGAVVPPTVIPPVVTAVAATTTLLPPLTTTPAAPTELSVTVVAVVAAAVTAAPPKPVVVSLVRPVQPEASTATVPPEDRLAVSTFLTTTLAGTEIAAVSATVSVSVPLPPSMLSKALSAAVETEPFVMVSLPAVPGTVSIPAVRLRIRS